MNVTSSLAAVFWNLTRAGLLAAIAVAAALGALGQSGGAWPPRIPVAEANGTATIIMDQVQGPYRVKVGIIPARPIIPQTHLAIQVFDRANEQLLRDTDVQVHVVAAGPPGAVGFGPQLVRNEDTLRYFEVDVPFDVVGPWDVSLTVSSARGEERFSLPLDVGEPGLQLGPILITLFLVLVLAVGIWTLLKLRRQRRSR